MRHMDNKPMRDQGEGILRQPARKSLDLARQMAMVKEGKILPHHFCPADLQALASQQREYAESVERGEIRGKEPCDPWTQRARDERGKPVERRVHLATESTPEKPILLGGGGYSCELDDFLRYTLSSSDARRKKVKKELDSGKSIEKVLTAHEYKQYREHVGQSSTNIAGESEEPSYESNSALEPLDGYHPHFPARYPYESDRVVLSGNLREGCVVDATRMLLYDQGIPTSEQDIAKELEHDEDEGTDWENMIPVLTKYGHSYEKGNINSVRELAEIVNNSSFAVASRIAKDGERRHRLVVDKVEMGRNGSPQFICIRDSRKGGSSYKVTVDAWNSVWIGDDVVPSVASNNNYYGSSSSNSGYGSYSAPRGDLYSLPPIIGNFPGWGDPGAYPGPGGGSPW